MDIQTAIKNRRSVRKFLDRKIEPEIISRIIEAATFAPSACNTQGWRFIVVEDQRLKEKIVALGGAKFIQDAPLGILVTYDQRTENLEYQDHIQSASAAVQNLLLAAFAEGLASCWVCHLPSKQDLRKLFHIPASFSPIAYIVLGYPEKEAQPVPRQYQPEQVMAYNRFPAVLKESDTNTLKLTTKRTLREIYFSSPVFLKKLVGPLLDKRFTKKFKN